MLRAARPFLAAEQLVEVGGWSVMEPLPPLGGGHAADPLEPGDDMLYIAEQHTEVESGIGLRSGEHTRELVCGRAAALRDLVGVAWPAG